MEGYDGYFGVHLARTWTDLLLEPYSQYWRGRAVERNADAPSIPGASWLNAPKMG